jgi:hypothetical protein
MKGIVFSEFLDMVEDKFSPEIADKILSNTQLQQADGSYTRVGTYHHADLISLVVSLSQESGVPGGELVKAFGKYLFGRFVELYPSQFAGISGATDFLKRIHEYVHVDVQKLYPDAELPSFTWNEENGAFSFFYESSRPFADLAEGLIQGCLEHFGESYAIERENLVEDGSVARFILVPSGHA